jgi:hypothetical protein
MPMLHPELAMRKMMLVVAALCVTSCANGGEDAQPTRTQAERDSIIGQSKLPGAPAVQGARDVQKTAADRASSLDSIRD